MNRRNLFKLLTVPLIPFNWFNKKEISTKTVWVLHTSHRHGDDILVFSTEEKARQALVDYCCEYWYFENSTDEYANIFESNIDE